MKQSWHISSDWVHSHESGYMRQNTSMGSICPQAMHNLRLYKPGPQVQRDLQEDSRKRSRETIRWMLITKKEFFSVFQCLCYYSYSNKMNFKQERFCKLSKAFFPDSILKQFKESDCLLIIEDLYNIAKNSKHDLKETNSRQDHTDSKCAPTFSLGSAYPFDPK